MHIGHDISVQGVGGGQVVGDSGGESGGHVISGQVMGGRVGGQVEGSGHVSPEIAWYTIYSVYTLISTVNYKLTCVRY